MNPRSELGKLDEALRLYATETRWEGWHLAQSGAEHDEKSNVARRDADRRRKNIIERVRKLMQKAERRGKASRRVDRENTP